MSGYMFELILVWCSNIGLFGNSWSKAGVHTTDCCPVFCTEPSYFGKLNSQIFMIMPVHSLINAKIEKANAFITNLNWQICLHAMRPESFIILE